MDNVKIIIGGDLVPTKSNEELFTKADSLGLLGKELKEILDLADYRIFNLEVPLTDKLDPISKCGPAIIASTSTVAGIKEIGVDFVTLANNHILDQGENGLESTMETLRKKNIEYAGVGKTISEASKPHILKIGERKIGIYCCAEHEFTIATEASAGANPFDPLESLDHISELKKETDYVIVLYHGGKEHYRYPSPRLQKVCRKIVEKGADLVICQHSHCIGCEEKWKQGTIVYGQGNFIFDYSKSEYWETSILVEIEMNKEICINYIPLVKNGGGVRIAKDEGKEILEAFQKRTEEISKVGFVETTYKKLAEESLPYYLTKIQGKRNNSMLFKIVNKILRNSLRKMIAKYLYNENGRNTLYNYLECEAHRELFLKGLEESDK